MDAAARQMLADLGLGRRDELSTADDIHHGRAPQLDARGAAQIRAEVQARRFEVTESDAVTGDGRADILRRWNTAATFERDAVTEQLEDRFSGQGHRAELRRRHGTEVDGHGVTQGTRFGEERRSYTPSRNHRAGDGGPVRGPLGFRSLLSGSTVDRSDRRRAGPTTRPSNSQNRAPSPRAAGTIRFGRDGTRSVLTPGEPRSFINPGHQAGLQAAETMRSFGVERSHTAQAATPVRSPSHASPSMLQSIHAPQPSSAASSQRDHVASTPASTPARTPASTPASNVTNTPVNNIASRPASNVVNRPVNNITSRPAMNVAPTSSHDPVSVERYRAQALWYAANPGSETDDQYGRFPDRIVYLGEARHRLIQEALELVEAGDEQAIRVYIETHKERKWMVDAARKAKQQIEEDHSTDELDQYIASNPRQKAFLQYATTYFSPVPVVQPPEELSPQPSPRSNASSENSYASATTSISTPDSATIGTLSVGFTNAAGQALEGVDVTLNVPVAINMSVESTTFDYDPRELRKIVEEMAERLRELRPSPPIVGARLTRDGLWQEGGEDSFVVVGAKVGDDGLWEEEEDLM